MESASQENVTALLNAWGRGDESALERLTPIVYSELYRIARLRMLGEARGHILQPSALVNELFLRLIGSVRGDWVNRSQFYALAARIMRQILTDLARASNSQKRGGDAQQVDVASLNGLSDPSPSVAREDLLAVDAALTRLETIDPRRSKVVELRFYGGLEIPEIAEVLGVSEATIARDWRVARATLLSLLQPTQTE